VSFRVVTYNVHKCQGLDRRTTATRIAEVLRDIDADIVALQEVLDHQAECISSELGMPFAIGENRKHLGYGYGNVLLSRFPIQHVKNYDVSVRGREERGCLRADVALHGGSLLHVFNVHLGTGFMERRHQGRRFIAPELLTEPVLRSPRVVLGDFNEWTQGLATRLLRSHLKSADARTHLRARTYPVVLPILQLDHIYYDPSLELEKLTLCRTRKALIASDHLPLIAEFTMKQAASAA